MNQINPINHKKYPAWLEIIPLVLFFALSKYFNIYVATVALMVGALINFILGTMINKKINYIALFAVILALVFGGLTIFFKNEDFIKIKVTILNVLLAVILLTGLITKTNFLKLLLGEHLSLTAKGWLVLNLLWIGFFTSLAILNELIWRNFDTSTWINFKVFGVIVMTILFSLLMAPIIRKYKSNPNENDSDSKIKK